MKRVLVVDDDVVSQMLVVAVTKRVDSTIEVIKASDGLEAMHIIDQTNNNVDVILLDLNMPRMNGFEFLKAYHQKTTAPASVAIYTSSEKEEDRKQTSIYDFVKMYCLKPLHADDLQKIITTSL